MQPKDVVLSAHVMAFVASHYNWAGFTDEPIHGMRHLNNVLQEAEIIIQKCAINPNMAYPLKIAAMVHDIGRTMTGDHARNSAELFSQMPLYDLSAEEKSWIEFAVRNHNRGVKAATGHEVASSPEEILLGLLCVCDHADGASPEGYARSIMWAKTFKPYLPIFSHHNVAHLQNVMTGKLPGIKHDDYENESVVAHLAYNFFATREIMKAVKHLLSGKYIKYAEMRQIMFGKMIELLLELQPL